MDKVFVVVARQEDNVYTLAVLRHEPTSEECWELLANYLRKQNPTLTLVQQLSLMDLFTGDNIDVTNLPVLP